MPNDQVCPTGRMSLQPASTAGQRGGELSSAKAPAGFLSEAHRRELQQSGLTPETIAASKIYTAFAEQVAAILKFTAGPGMVIPYPNFNGNGEFRRVKPNTPFVDRYGRAAKYLTTKGAGNRIYVPPGITPQQLADHKIALFITEGEKKALKGAQEGLCCVAVPGVWSWKQRSGNRSVPIPDLDLIAWKYRAVYLVFDSDLRAKKEVATALYELSRELERRQARVRKIDLPDGPRGEKVGLDDYLLGHSIEIFCSLPHSPVLPPEFAYIEITPVTEFIRKTLPNREAIIANGILYPKSRLGLTGPGKKGKSMLVQNIVLSLAAGVPLWNQFAIPKPRRVAYIQSEVSPQAIQDRFKTMIDSRAAENLMFSSALLVNAPNLKIDSKEGFRAIQMIIENSQAEVVVFDPLYKLHAADENKTDQMRNVIDQFEKLIEQYAISIGIVHHHGKTSEGKDEGHLSRGSSVFGDWVDTQLVFRGNGDTVDGRHLRKLSFVLRNDIEPGPIDLVLNPETLWFEPQHVEARDLSEVQKAIQVATELMGRNLAVDVTNVQRHLTISKPTARKILSLLPLSEWETYSGPRGATCYRPRPENQGVSQQPIDFHENDLKTAEFSAGASAMESSK